MGVEYTLPIRAIPVGDPHWPQGRPAGTATAVYEPNEVELMQGLARKMRAAEKAGDIAERDALKDEMLAIHEMKAQWPGAAILPLSDPMHAEVWSSFTEERPVPSAAPAPAPVAAEPEQPQVGYFTRLWEDRQEETKTKPVARSTDPDTSHAAAASILSEEVRVRQRAIYTLLQEYGPMTDEEIAERYEQRGYFTESPKQSPSGLRTRRHELEEAGYVVDTGEKRPTLAGRASTVWAVSHCNLLDEVA